MITWLELLKKDATILDLSKECDERLSELEAKDTEILALSKECDTRFAGSQSQGPGDSCTLGSVRRAGPSTGSKRRQTPEKGCENPRSVEKVRRAAWEIRGKRYRNLGPLERVRYASAGSQSERPGDSRTLGSVRRTARSQLEAKEGELQKKDAEILDLSKECGERLRKLEAKDTEILALSKECDTRLQVF